MGGTLPQLKEENPHPDMDGISHVTPSSNTDTVVTTGIRKQNSVQSYPSDRSTPVLKPWAAGKVLGAAGKLGETLQSPRLGATDHLTDLGQQPRFRCQGFLPVTHGWQSTDPKLRSQLGPPSKPGSNHDHMTSRELPIIPKIMKLKINSTP